MNFSTGTPDRKSHWLKLISGLIFVFLVIIISVFYTVRPYLDDFVRKEMVRRSIKAETAGVSIMGKVNLTNVTIPISKDVFLKIGALSGRPPIAFIPGTFTLYDVVFKQGNIHLRIPRMSLNRISLKEKNTEVTSRAFQMLMRINAASISAHDIFLNVGYQGKPIATADVKNFRISGLKDGRIRSATVQNMVTNLNLTGISSYSKKSNYFVAKSHAIKVQNLDVAYAYSLLSQEKTFNSQNKGMIGPISLENFAVDLFQEDKKKASFFLGKLKTAAFKTKSFEQPLKELIQNRLITKKTRSANSEKLAWNSIIINALSAVPFIETQIQKANFEGYKLKMRFESLKLARDNWNPHIPKKLFLSFEDLSILPHTIKKNLGFLKQIDLENLDISGTIDSFYDKDKKSLSLKTISFDVKDMGSGQISAKLTGVNQALFSGQKNAMISAAKALGVTEVNIHYTDSGLIDKLFSYFAQSVGDTEHDLKKELYDDFYIIAVEGSKTLLKNYKDSENISKSLGDFVKNPQTLTIKIKTKNNKGLTMKDLEMALQNNLPALLNKVTLTVKNEESR